MMAIFSSILGLVGLGGVDPDQCLVQQADIAPAQRVGYCTTLIEKGDPQLRAHFFDGRGSAHRELGDLTAAREDFDRAVALEPDDLVFLTNRAVVAYDQEDDITVVDDLARLIAADPGDAAIYSLRSQSLYRLRRLDEALHDIGRALDLAEPTDVRLYRMGRTLVELGRYEEAIPYLTRALDIDPTYRLALERRLTAHTMLGHREAVIEDTERLLAIDPDDIDALASLCKQFLVSDPDRALSHCDKVLSLDPKRAPAWNDRAIIMRAKGDDARSREDMDRTVDLWPQEPVFRANRAIMRIEDGDFKGAGEDVAAGLEEAADYLPLRICQAQLSMIAGHASTAETILTQVLSANPDEPAGITSFAWLRLSQGRLSEALDLFQAILERSFGAEDQVRERQLRWMSLYGRGLSKMRGGRHAEGEADLSAARSMKKNVDDILARWGPEFSRKD